MTDHLKQSYWQLEAAASELREQVAFATDGLRKLLKEMDSWPCGGCEYAKEHDNTRMCSECEDGMVDNAL